MRPRQLSTVELIAVLEKEHESLLATLKTLQDAISREDAKTAFSIVGGIDETLIQHMTHCDTTKICPLASNENDFSIIVFSDVI